MYASDEELVLMVGKDHKGWLGSGLRRRLMVKGVITYWVVGD